MIMTSGAGGRRSEAGGRRPGAGDSRFVLSDLRSLVRWERQGAVRRGTVLVEFFDELGRLELMPEVEGDCVRRAPRRLQNLPHEPQERAGEVLPPVPIQRLVL